jgi:predicted AlkP superfamily pyrophosphatase or phosphodiesterase
MKGNLMNNDEYAMIDIAPTVSAVLNLPAPAQSWGVPIQEIVTDLNHEDRIALIVPDALGLFAWNLWHDQMPCLQSLHNRHSIVLRSVMPSITPVNFSAMVTGNDVSGHGVLTFEDSFACETLFDVVRRTGGKSAGVGLDGYTGSELLGRFADIWGNAGKGDDANIEEKILEIVDLHQPEFIIAQLGKVDDVFHQYGPSSPLVVPMLKDLDGRLDRLVSYLNSHAYGVIILSDHGQHDVDEEDLRGTHGTDSDIDCLVPCTWV